MDTTNESSRKSKNLHKPSFILKIFRFIFKYIGAVVPTLVGRWSYHLWFLTYRLPTPKREQDWIASARTEAIDIDGLEVMTHYWADERHGPDAPLVMLVHGWTGRGSQMGAFAEPLLKAGFRVLSFDNHSHGQTAGKASTIFKQSEIQLGLAQKLGPVYAVIAHSFGGMVTSYSLSQGMEAKKVVCISPPSRFDYLLERFSNTLQLPTSIQHYMVKRFKKDYGDDLAERVSATTTSLQLGHIPALIIHDQDDQDVPISESELLHNSWPNSQLQRTNGLEHRRILYNEGVLQSAVNFLQN